MREQDQALVIMSDLYESWVLHSELFKDLGMIQLQISKTLLQESKVVSAFEMAFAGDSTT